MLHSAGFDVSALTPSVATMRTSIAALQVSKARAAAKPTALHLAALHGWDQICTSLLAHGAPEHVIKAGLQANQFKE